MSSGGQSAMGNMIDSITMRIIVAASLCLTASAASAQNYDPGASDTEIKLGNITPYSGPVSALAVIKLPDIDPYDGTAVAGYLSSQTLIELLKRCGDDLSRDNIMKQAMTLNLSLPMLLPGVHSHHRGERLSRHSEREVAAL